jgi:hypothetical protein
MKQIGIHGAVRGKVIKTTVPDTSAPCPRYKVNRVFCAPAPHLLWVSDFTYVSTAGLAGLCLCRLRHRHVCRPHRGFCDATNVTPNGLGFTRGDIFIPPHMITAEGIQAGDLVEGIAIASFDKKRGKWGMKAIQAKSIARNHFEFGNENNEW